MTETPVGSVVAFAGPRNNIPDGWYLCDGRGLSRNNETALFNAIGTSWGGDGAPIFFLPDLRGQFLRGVDLGTDGSATGMDPESAARQAFVPPGAPQNPGNRGNTVGSFQLPATALPASAFAVSQVGDHTHDDPTWNGQGGPYELAVGAARGPGGSDFIPKNETSPAGGHTHTLSGGDAETRPRNAYVFWIIRAR
jgi:hypothetical protein